MRVSPAWLYAMIDLRFYPFSQDIFNIHYFKVGRSLLLILLLILYLVPFLPGVMIFPKAHFVELCPALSLVIFIQYSVIRIQRDIFICKIS